MSGTKFESTVIFKNNTQMNIAAELEKYVQQITSQENPPVVLEDVSRALLVSAIAQSVLSTLYNNQRQFTAEDKKKLLNEVEELIDAQTKYFIINQIIYH
jgi:hypothetical protein